MRTYEEEFAILSKGMTERFGEAWKDDPAVLARIQQAARISSGTATPEDLAEMEKDKKNIKKVKREIRKTDKTDLGEIRKSLRKGKRK